LADAPKEIRLADCENFIRQIRDVISVNIVAENGKEITEIHVLAEDSRNPKQIVRDIETLFRVEYGLDLDHKKISVVQLRKEQRNLNEKRLKFSSINLNMRGNKMEALVELASEKKSCKGQKSGVLSRQNRLRLTAEAALQAAAGFLAEESSIVLDDIALFTLGGRNIVCIAVTLVRGMQEDNLVGCALVSQDEKEAVVRAALNAINRRVSTDI
jgi:hypothetical protein